MLPSPLTYNISDCAVNILQQFYSSPILQNNFVFRPPKKGTVIGPLFEIYQHLSRHNVVGFPGMPNYPDNRGFYWKTTCHQFFFSQMFLPHEHGSLLTKVVMFEIIFSI